MERIYIIEDDKKTVFEGDGKSYRASVFYDDGRIEPIGDHIFDIFNIFVLSNNNTPLPNEGKYRVILDNETGFKHYFIGDDEDYLMFYNNNGEDAIMFYEELKDNGWKPKEQLTVGKKLFKVGKKTVEITYKGLLIVVLAVTLTATVINTQIIIKQPERLNSFKTIPLVELFNGVEDFTVDDLVSKIKSSEKISSVDQEFLANRDFLEDVLVYANSSNYSKFRYYDKFKNIEIRVFDHTKISAGGYYNSGESNVIYIADNCLGLNRYYTVISHEFIHLCQGIRQYNFITEACAEIFSSEYFDDSEHNAYPKQIYIVKKLMEIIGAEPVFKYNFTDNFSDIENAIRPYLTDNEYDGFINALNIKKSPLDSYKYDEKDLKTKANLLNNLLDTIYYRKFGQTVDNDPVIPYLKKGYSLVRYYFNKRKIDKEESYVLIPSDDSVIMPLKTAMDQGIVSFFQFNESSEKILISYDDYINGNYDAEREFYGFSAVDASIQLEYEDDEVYCFIIPSTSKKSLPSLEQKLDLLNHSRSI